MQYVTKRLRRFTRAPDAAGAFRITPRDLDILRRVAEHRFIRSHWLVKLAGGSPQQVLRRIHLLYHHGYLERPRAQLDYYYEGGSHCLVYGLGSRGAGRLRRDLNMPFHRMDWTRRNGSVGRLFLKHALMTSDFMAQLELACVASVNARLIAADELPSPRGREESREPHRWTVDLPGKRRVGVVPDKVFALETTGSDGRAERIYYFLEADRGTMPIERCDLRQSCFLRKLRAYEATWTSNVHRDRLSIPRFRVLTVTNSPERAAHLIQAASKLERGKGLFLVTDVPALSSAENVLGHEWRCPAGGKNPPRLSLLNKF